MNDSTKIRVAVTGACGRMGSLIVENVNKAPDMELVAAFDRIICNDAITDTSKLSETLHRVKPEVVIDFTEASSSTEIIKTAAAAGVRLVVGTTGHSADQREEIRKAIDGKVAALVSPNFSIGVNVFWRLVKEASEHLPSPAYPAEVIEAHHKHKTDAPSGTAIKAMDVIKEVGGERTIGSYSIRSGDIVGEHTVLFIGDGERLEITHRAHSRQAFASGAMMATRFIVAKPPGMYSMDDLMAEMKS